MASKRFVFKISARLLGGALFFIFAFLLFLFFVGSSLSQIGRNNSEYHQKRIKIDEFVAAILIETDNLIVENQALAIKVANGETDNIRLNTLPLQNIIDKQMASSDFSQMPDYFQKTASEILSMARQTGSVLITNDGDVHEVARNLSGINHLLKKMIDDGVVSTQELGVQMAQSQGKIREGIVLWMSVAIVIALLINIFIIRSVRVRVKKTLHFAKEVANGNLAAVSEVQSGDEIGLINEAIDAFRNKLRGVLSSIKEISMSVTNASAEFNSGSQLISSGASAQASSAEEIAAAMEQIADVIQQSANNANETGRIAKNAFEGIQQGANHVEQALDVIEDIAQKNSVIGEISYQTKILSINASVEASRAAEVGRGFSVVADEVKRLAESTQSSASEIKLVSKKGVDLAQKSANELRELVGEFQRTTELVDQIVVASNEHINTINQINFSLQDLNNITQQNASSAEELAASSSELVKLTKSLDELIDYFKLDEDKTEPKEQPDEDKTVINEAPVADTPVSNYDYSKERQAFEEILNQRNKSQKEVVGTTFFAGKIIEEVPVQDTIAEPDHFDFEKVEAPLPDRESSVVHSNRDKTVKKEDKKEPSKPVKTFKPKISEEKQMPRNAGQGVRINLKDNDDLDSQFEKIK